MQTEGFMGEKEEVLSKEVWGYGDRCTASGIHTANGIHAAKGVRAENGTARAAKGVAYAASGAQTASGMDEMAATQKLLAVKKELALRKEDKLAAYNVGRKRHKKQIAFHKCKKRNRWVFGGNRTGKTECGAVEAVYMARGVHPYRKNRKNVAGWVVSLSQQVQRDVAQEKILSYLSPRYIVDIVMLSGRKDNPAGGIIDRIVVKNELGGTSTIGFKSCDQGREKFQGASLDFVWFDEEPPKDIYDECKMRVLDRRGDIFGTMTPLKGLTFVYDEIYLNERGDQEVWYEFMEWADNPFLSKKEVEAYTKSLSSDQLESRRYGRFTEGSGPVYGEFDENVHVIDPFPIPPDWQDCVSIDPGLHNPLSAHFYAVDYDGNVYVVAEHFEAEKNVDYHAAKISEIAHTLGWKRDAKGRVEAYIDSAAGQHTLNGAKSVCELFYDCGIAVNANVNKDLFSGIAQVKRYLKEGKLFIFKNCPNLIRELKAYRWQEGDRPRKEDDHALDELRYYLMTKPKKTFRPELPAAIREKERLIRLNARRRRNFS
ncbi:MAG: terminase family protein [Clostridia bacterium]|nr:terminase family protein [Clostridia bacterium]